MFTGFAAYQGVAEVEAMEKRPIREQEDMGYRFRKNFLKIVWLWIGNAYDLEFDYLENRFEDTRVIWDVLIDEDLHYYRGSDGVL